MEKKITLTQLENDGTFGMHIKISHPLNKFEVIGMLEYALQIYKSDKIPVIKKKDPNN